jgi:hypothetical protein
MLVSGGHVRPRLGDSFILSYPQFGQYLDAPLQGPDKVAEVVRAVIARGADVIKVGASERAGLARTDPRRPELSYEELRAAVAVAAEAGRWVAAHAHDRQGANAAVRAGVRSIEHGTYLDDETLALMRQQGTFFVPTLAIMSPLGDPRGDGADDIALQLRTLHMMRPLRDAVRSAPRTKTFEGKRRQIQYRGKLMRRAQDAGAIEPIREAVASFQLGHARDALSLHEAERWRAEFSEPLGSLNAQMR